MICDNEFIKILANYGIDEAREYLEDKRNKASYELYSKACDEFDKFISTAKKEEKDVIVELAYEIIIKADFLTILENDELSYDTIETLIKEDYPLDTLYNCWIKNDYTYMDYLRDTIKEYVKDKETYKKDKER